MARSSEWSARVFATKARAHSSQLPMNSSFLPSCIGPQHCCARLSLSSICVHRARAQKSSLHTFNKAAQPPSPRARLTRVCVSGFLSLSPPTPRHPKRERNQQNRKLLIRIAVLQELSFRLDVLSRIGRARSFCDCRVRALFPLFCLFFSSRA
jgi:hypothetical protein